MKKTIGIILSVICLIVTAASILGIITANTGKVETISPDQLQELYAISAMPFAAPPEGGSGYGENTHPRSDTFVQLVKKMSDTSLTGRLRVLEGLTKKYDSLEAELVKGGMKQGTPETQKELETRFVEDVQSYGLFSDVTHLSTWEKICMFTITWRSVMLIFGFLGLGLALAIVSSSTVKSDLD